MIEVFILDDHEILRRGVRDLLESEPDIRVVGEAATAEQGMTRIVRLRPHVALLDVLLPDGDGVTVCRDVRSAAKEVGCLIFTSVDDDDALFDAITAGAVGYVIKSAAGTALVSAVRAVAMGHSILDPRAVDRVMARLRGETVKTADPYALLTNQERTLLALIGDGLTNREIGERIFLAEGTVKNHVSMLLAKLGLQRRAQAAAHAARMGALH